MLRPGAAAAAAAGPATPPHPPVVVYASPATSSATKRTLEPGAVAFGDAYADGWVSLVNGGWLMVCGTMGGGAWGASERVAQVGLQVRVITTLICPTVLGKLQRETVMHKEQLRELRQLAYRNLIAADEADAEGDAHATMLSKLQEKVREQETEELALHREMKAAQAALAEVNANIAAYQPPEGGVKGYGEEEGEAAWGYEAPAAAVATVATAATGSELKWRACMEPTRCVRFCVGVCVRRGHARSPRFSVSFSSSTFAVEASTTSSQRRMPRRGTSRTASLALPLLSGFATRIPTGAGMNTM